MKGSSKVIDFMNKMLTGELTSVDIYLVQARMLEEMGYKKLADRLIGESGDEREHADQFIKRILFLEGRPNMEKRNPIRLVETPLEMMKLNLAAEIITRDDLRAGIKICLEEGDTVTRQILEHQLIDTEEDHLHWFEMQINLAEELGVVPWLAENM